MPPQLTPPASPTASLFDVSDDEEGEYNTIRHQRTGRGIKLLYSKSKVYVHPSPSAKDNIPGFIALLQQKSPIGIARPSSSSTSQFEIHPSSLLLAWVPESSLGDALDSYVQVDLANSDEPPKQTLLVPSLPTTSRAGSAGSYAFAVPVNEIYSLFVRPPKLSWWHGSVVINTRGGDSFPALFFHDGECQSTITQRRKLTKETFDPFSDGGGMYWGGDEVLKWLKQYVTVERSSHELNVFLLNPTEADKLGFGASSTMPKSSGSKQEGSTPQRDGGMDPLTKAFKEARWNILEKLSQVTSFTRRTAQAISENPQLPPQIRRLMRNPEVQIIQDEFDSARLYLARWAMGIAEQSEREKSRRIYTAKDVLEMEESTVGEFEILDMEASKTERRKPVTKREWDSWFDDSGRLILTADEVKDQIFHGGLDPEDGVRKDAWLFLLGVYEWTSSRDERSAHMSSLRDEYIKLKGSWWERMDSTHGTLEQREWFKEQKNRIEKDVHRTDRNIPIFAGEDIPHPDPDSPFADVGTNVHLEQMKDMLLTYNEYNTELGYVQGMSDLLAPIYAVMQDDAAAFWTFINFMKRMERNFLRDQSGMRLQLLTLDHLVQLMDPKLYLHLQSADSTNFFFFFRFLLIWFKREFQWEDVLRLWEVLWTDWLSGNFHLFIALAILEKHRDVMMTHLKHFDEVLKYVNELSSTLDLNSTLVKAELLFRKFQRTIEAIDKKDNFPAPRLRHRPGRSTVGTSTGQAVSSGADIGVAQSDSATTSADGQASKKVVSSELRALLSRDPPEINPSEVKEAGGGIN